jgi:hypothetical protein
MTNPDYRDRSDNDMAGLLDFVAEAESFDIKWYRYPAAKQISEDWPQFFKQEQQKRVGAYLRRRANRLDQPQPVPPIIDDDIPDLGLF